MKSYVINDPWDWVTHFETAIANYTGAKYAIACDSTLMLLGFCFITRE